MSTKLVPLLLILVFSSSFLLHLSSAAFLCNERDAITLLKIKKHFGDGQNMALWNKSSDCCKWPDVFCSPNGRVSELIVFHSNVSGPIPELFTELSALEILVIQKHPNLSGPIPDFFAKFPSIRSVQINYNANLSGPIPPSLCSLARASDSLITLTTNRLTGSIPDCFGAGSPFLDFSHNQLTGSIPASIMKGVVISQLAALDLHDNKLSGPIPRSLGDRELGVINLSGNRLTGDASFLFGMNKSTFEINLSRNKLEFDLSRVKFPSSLAWLDISRNRIWGRIPKQIAEVPNFNFFDVSHNKLCGPIPKSSVLLRFDKKFFAHNKCLCGAPLPQCQRSFVSVSSRLKNMG